MATMTLEEIKQVVNELSVTDILALRGYLNTIPIDVSAIPVQERIRQLQEAAREIREGLSSEEFELMIADMNSEYIEPLDDDSWID